MRVLIAEDERRMAEQLRRGLEREGYSVLVAADGQQALDAFIHLLRSKIDAEQPVKLIHTVRGVGYCVRAEQP